MTLNWRLGLFRLWLLAAILFALAVSIVSYSTVREAFAEADYVERFADKKGGTAIPQACDKARGAAGTDYTSKRSPRYLSYEEAIGAKPLSSNNIFDSMPTGLEGLRPNDNCWYAMVDFRRLYPELSKIPDEDLVHKQYRGLHAEVFEHPSAWPILGYWLAVALGIPLAFLVLGAALVWALSGFGVKRITA